MSVFEKRQIIAEVNCANKTFFKYDYKTDSVIEEFSNSYPMSFDDWYAKYVR